MVGRFAVCLTDFFDMVQLALVLRQLFFCESDIHHADHITGWPPGDAITGAERKP